MVAKYNKVNRFFTITKNASLPDTEDGARNTKEEKKAVVAHNDALYILGMAFQTNIQLSSFISESETDDWPSGQAHVVMNKVETNFRRTQTGMTETSIEVKKDEDMDSIEWNRNTNPQEVWKEVSAVSLKYRLTSRLSEKDKIKWVTRHAPPGYSDTIANAEAIVAMQRKDFSYVLTYDDLQARINMKFEEFERATKKRVRNFLIRRNRR
jgi:hypothetical protein